VRSIAVLGAGRLYDLDTDALAHRFDEITLVDADPNCLPAWSAYGQRLPGTGHLTTVVTDITGVLGPWSAELRTALEQNRGASNPWKEALSTIRRFGEKGMPNALNLNADAVLSLNILSQLPLGWQALIERELHRSFGRSLVKERETEWLESYTVSGKRIIEAHLRDLAALPAREILVVTDLRYAFPGASDLTWESETTEAEPADQPMKGRWKSGTLSSLEEMDALLGASIAMNSPTESLGGRVMKHYRPWVWDLSPQRGSEKAEKHLVTAFSLGPKRSDKE
ncbi:MAG: hypothetical protein IT290_04495, partial [Deltaproteobacteria bacterium]|nr:hypothetical protein [Deltaproteobacteria bacterium]